MSRQNLIKKLKKNNSNLNNKEIEKIINIFCETIEKGLKQGRKIELRGFGTFFIKKIKEKYNARNPNTKELIYVPEKKKVRLQTECFKNEKKIISGEAVVLVNSKKDF